MPDSEDEEIERPSGPFMEEAEQIEVYFQKRLEDLIEAAGTNPTVVARKLHRGRSYVRDALIGEKRITVELIVRVLRTLNLDPGVLLRLGDDESTVAEPGISYQSRRFSAEEVELVRQAVEVVIQRMLGR